MRFWLSWYAVNDTPSALGAFELHSPWWVSGEGEDDVSVCAAVIADNEEQAKAAIVASYDDKSVFLKWRFVHQKDDNWSPFSGRFPQAPWMVWPAPGEA